MANSELERTFKKRTFRCSDAEWEKITQTAKDLGLSTSHFIVEKTCSDGGGGLVGLAHYRAMPSPLRRVNVGFLDDLFVAPASRGGNIGGALLNAN